ncbi:Protein still life, isoform SIF type 1 [Halotydeus destructor]|nr:Protein still life, isoform SIF type 1 [Halotydeus destructor]
MGNKLSCSCSPLVKKAYKYDDVPLQQQKRGRDGHLLRLWAEVFHVSATSGAVRWQQVSEDLVPVNITCIQDSPECVFHITAYNSQVEKILDVRLHQPGTRLGQASECFVYWKDPHTGDTWGLNFTSPLDAKQFRELCSPSFKFARKASSSYSLRLTDGQKRGDRTPGGGAGATGGPAKKKASQSTPASPNRRARESGYNTNTEEPQCTCMTADNLHRQRNGRVRYTASATLPRSALRQDSSTANQSAYISAYPSTTSVNAIGQQQQRATSRAAANSSAQQQQQAQQGQPGGQQRAAGGGPAGQQQANYRNAQYSRAQYAQSVRRSTDQSRSMDNAIYREQQYRQQQQQQRAGQRAGQAQHSASQGQGHHGRPQTRADHHAMAGAGTNGQLDTVGQSRSKSTDDVRRCTGSAGTEDTRNGSRTLRRTVVPISGQQSVGTGGGHGGGLAGTAMMGGGKSVSSTGTNTSMSQPTSRRQPEHQRNGGGGSGPSVGSMARPTSVPGWGSGMMTGENLDRSRRARSEVGVRRSLERRPCVDFTDRSPTSTDHYLLSDNMAAAGPNSGPGGGGAGTGSHRSYRGPLATGQ